MQNQPTGDTAASDEDTQRLILTLVASQDQRPWSLEEIIRVMAGTTTRVTIEDALTYLQSVGLLNRADNIYFASQAAAHADRLGMLMM